jgi:hypothetical protein
MSMPIVSVNLESDWDLGKCVHEKRKVGLGVGLERVNNICLLFCNVNRTFLGVLMSCK